VLLPGVTGRLRDASDAFGKRNPTLAKVADRRLGVLA
jgi:hypothetical protein